MINPKIYNFDERLNDPNPNLRWRVSRYRKEIKLGDLAFIWRAGEPRGIIAALTIVSDPYFLPYDPRNPEWTEEWKVDTKIIAKFPTLLSPDLKQIPGLEQLSVFHGYQAATNFKVSDAEGKVFLNLLGLGDLDVSGLGKG